LWNWKVRGATYWLELIAPFGCDKRSEYDWPLEAKAEWVLQGPPR